MITLKEWMELADYRISEGSDFCWNCYGANAYMLDSWNGEQDGHSFTVIFDTKTQVVYEVQAHDYVHNRAYRMINPDFQKKAKKEARKRDINKDTAWDDVDYVDLEVDDDFIQKCLAIREGEDYDTRVSIPLDLPERDLVLLFKAAHERDLTFNQFVEQALKELLDEFHSDPDGLRQRLEQHKDKL
jgi:hypothetical protein